MPEDSSEMPEGSRRIPERTHTVSVGILLDATKFQVKFLLKANSEPWNI